MKKSLLKKYEEALLILCEISDADYLTVAYTDAESKFSKLMTRVHEAVKNS